MFMDALKRKGDVEEGLMFALLICIKTSIHIGTVIAIQVHFLQLKIIKNESRYRRKNMN